MRSFLVAVAGLMLLATGAAQAKVSITVDKDAQTMTVAVDGVQRYHWPVSTGNPSHETPNGSFRTFRMEEDHFSKEFDDAPMPHSIFFTKVGHAIHGTESEGKLGIPVSHGCVRLSRANATTLYALVQEEGVLNTTVTLTGSAQTALARIPAGVRYYVSIDIDAFDPSIAPGTGTPSHGGFIYYEVLEILAGLARRGAIVGVDLVETAPDYDPAGITAILAAQLLLNLLGRMLAQK